MPRRFSFCIVRSRRQAEEILHRLESERFSDESISVIFPDQGALPIPGIGPFIAAGPIVSALSRAADAACAGIAGGLIGLGIPGAQAQGCQSKIEAGNFLLSVHAASADELDRAMRIFAEMGAQDIYNPGEPIFAR